MTQWKFPERIDPKKCSYVDDSKLPVLVLALSEDYPMKDERGWRYIAHQTAGHGCHQHYMKGRVLRPTKPTLAAMRFIDDFWLESDCGIFGVSLEEVNTYNMQLQGLLRASANRSHADFEEGIYPLDYSPRLVRRLTTTRLPEKLDELIKGHFMPIVWWHLYILGRNCD